MPVKAEDIENILLALATGAQTYGKLSGTPAATHAGDAAAGLIVGLSSLLRNRSVEQVQQLLFNLAADPADRMDVSGLQSRVDAIIANRRAADARDDDSE